MDIKLKGKYKSITDFEWLEIPNFAILTGPNGAGKSQLLQLIYNSIIDNKHETERVTISNYDIDKNEVTFIQPEWRLDNTQNINLSTILNEN